MTRSTAFAGLAGSTPSSSSSRANDACGVNDALRVPERRALAPRSVAGNDGRRCRHAPRLGRPRRIPVELRRRRSLAAARWCVAAAGAASRRSIGTSAWARCRRASQGRHLAESPRRSARDVRAASSPPALRCPTGSCQTMCSRSRARVAATYRRRARSAASRSRSARRTNFASRSPWESLANAAGTMMTSSRTAAARASHCSARGSSGGGSRANPSSTTVSNSSPFALCIVMISMPCSRGASACGCTASSACSSVMGSSRSPPRSAALSNAKNCSADARSAASIRARRSIEVEPGALHPAAQRSSLAHLERVREHSQRCCRPALGRPR